MDLEQEKAKYLSQNAQPVPTWFFERDNGTIFACGETEAWNILKDRNRESRHRLIGSSDGTIYFNTLKNAKTEVSELISEKERLTEDLKRYTETEDELRFKQLKDDDDEMVVKVMSKRNDLKEKIIDIDSKLGDINKTIVEKAFSLELEVAKQNKVLPQNQDVYTPNQDDRATILMNLGK